MDKPSKLAGSYPRTEGRFFEILTTFPSSSRTLINTETDLSLNKFYFHYFWFYISKDSFIHFCVSFKKLASLQSIPYVFSNKNLTSEEYSLSQNNYLMTFLFQVSFATNSSTTFARVYFLPSLLCINLRIDMLNSQEFRKFFMNFTTFSQNLIISSEPQTFVPPRNICQIVQHFDFMISISSKVL